MNISGKVVYNVIELNIYKSTRLKVKGEKKIMKMDEWGPGFNGLMRLPVHELVDNSMYEVQGPTCTHHYYYYNCNGYPEFRDKEGKLWFGIYEQSNGYIFCKNDLNGYRSYYFKDLEVI